MDGVNNPLLKEKYMYSQFPLLDAEIRMMPFKIIQMIKWGYL